ncbi:hypothetical protein IFM89_038150 [Coptis chinensis]|uniref:Serine/threonine-protein phosphatase 4 regulatory subunit 2 n=1 Tax=Coptis chinensis TaxID=261450 RepID=A0A835HYZ7_9MAGN|nr:hypothetical protein IFM89_038150 [Coptis chinensis]
MCEEGVVMENMSVENSETASTLSSNDTVPPTEGVDIQPPLNHGNDENKCEITEEELQSILEIIAATGKFWNDWDTLKSLLSFRLKQVLTEYPEAQTTQDQQPSSLGETYEELVRRLEEALLSFTEGPPFTLQRLCEILLSARSIYPNLSKLALALEKNLLVTSTLTVSSDPYPSSAIQKPDEPDKGSVEPLPHSSPLQNGGESVVGIEDEEMADAEEVDIDNKSEETGTAEEIINGTSEASSDDDKSGPSGEKSPSRENINSTS